MFARAAKSVRNNILVGLVLVTPIVITGFIINWLFNFATNSFLALVPPAIRDTYPDVLFRTASLVIVVVALFFIGLFVKNILGKRLYQLGDMILARIPVINKLYIAVRQISEAFLDQQQTMFKDVVLVEYPRKGIFSIGFVTTSVPKKLTTGLPEDARDLVAIFIPTSPNPTSGMLIFVPRADLFHLPMSVGDAMKLVFSGGAVYPGLSPLDSRPTLLDKLEALLAREGRADKKVADAAAETKTGDRPADAP